MGIGCGFVSRTGLRSRIEHLCPSSIETYRRGKFFSGHGRVVIGVDVVRPNTESTVSLARGDKQTQYSCFKGLGRFDCSKHSKARQLTSLINNLSELIAIQLNSRALRILILPVPLFVAHSSSCGLIFPAPPHFPEIQSAVNAFVPDDRGPCIWSSGRWAAAES